MPATTRTNIITTGTDGPRIIISGTFSTTFFFSTTITTWVVSVRVLLTTVTGKLLDGKTDPSVFVVTSFVNADKGLLIPDLAVGDVIDCIGGSVKLPVATVVVATVWLTGNAPPPPIWACTWVKSKVTGTVVGTSSVWYVNWNPIPSFAESEEKRILTLDIKLYTEFGGLSLQNLLFKPGTLSGGSSSSTWTKSHPHFFPSHCLESELTLNDTNRTDKFTCCGGVMIQVQEEFAGYEPGKLGLLKVPWRSERCRLLSQAVRVPKKIEYREMSTKMLKIRNDSHKLKKLEEIW